MKTIIGLSVALVTVIVGNLLFTSYVAFTIVMWMLGVMLTSCCWVSIYRYTKIETCSTKYIEIIGFYLTLVGLVCALNSDVILNSDNLGRSVLRMFDKTNTKDLSELFEFEQDSLGKMKNNSHVVIVLDISGSTNQTLNDRWVNELGANVAFNDLLCKTKDFALTFSGLYNNEVSKVMQNIEKKPNKCNLFQLRALNFIMYLDSANRSLQETQKVDLTVIKFGKNTHIKSTFKNYISAIPYILDIESDSKEMSGKTDFVKLIDDVNTTIFIDTEEKDRQKKPQYVFAFFTDFLHDPSRNSVENKNYSMYFENKLIKNKLAMFNRKSNYSTFYFFSLDTMICGDYVKKMQQKRVFSVLPLIKSDDDWVNLKPIVDVDMIDLGVYRTRNFLPIYYTKPYVVEDDANVQLTFDRYKVNNDFSIAIKTIEGIPLRDQYVFYVGSCKKKKVIGKTDYPFEAYNDLSLNIQFQGNIYNQTPSRVLEIKDLKSGKRYELDTIFVKDFAPWVKYVLLNITFVFLVMLFVKIFCDYNANVK